MFKFTMSDGRIVYVWVGGSSPEEVATWVGLQVGVASVVDATREECLRHGYWSCYTLAHLSEALRGCTRLERRYRAYCCYQRDVSKPVWRPGEAARIEAEITYSLQIRAQRCSTTLEEYRRACKDFNVPPHKTHEARYGAQ